MLFAILYIRVYLVIQGYAITQLLCAMDDNNKIRSSIKSIHHFSDEVVDKFIAKLITKEINKREFLLKPPLKCNFMGFITMGSFRFHSLTDMGEQTLHFFTENTWAADYESLISQQPTKNYIQAMEDSEVQIISLDNIHLLMEEHPEFRHLFSLMSRWVITSSHYVSISNASPDDRYKKLLEEHPEWINRFPQMHIASYLGMTKETFSRVKARVK